MLIAAFVVWLLAGLPVVVRIGARWPTWLNVVLTVAFLPSFCLVGMTIAIGAVLAEWAWSNR
jgi:hypothetical protein